MADDGLAKVIPLFKDRTPPPGNPDLTTAFWTWGKTFVEDGVNNLAAIVDEIQTVTTEEQLLGLIRELKAEVADYPE